VREIDWKEVWKKFEKDMAFKLEGLSGHREVPDNLFEFRGIISHELPETAPIKIFRYLIKVLHMNQLK